MPSVPEGMRIDRMTEGSAHNQTRITWLENRGLGPWLGTTRGRGSLAIGVFGLAAISYVFFEAIVKFAREGNSSALFLGIMIGAGIIPMVYLLLCESCNQRVVLLDSTKIAAVWRPFPGFNSWKRPISSVTRLYYNDYCLYVEFSNGDRRFLLPRDMTGERHAYLKAMLEEELGLSSADEAYESNDEEPVAEKELPPHSEDARRCQICGTERDEKDACTTCGAFASAAVPAEVKIEQFESPSGHLGLEITVRSSWELVGLGLLPTVLALTLPGSVLLAGGMAALPYVILLLLPAAFLFYIHLLGNNRRIIRVDSNTLSVRYEPLPRPGWSRAVSDIEEFAEFPRFRFRPKFMPTEESDIVYLVAITRGLRWSPMVLHTYDKSVFRFVRRTLRTFFGKDVVRHG